MSWLPYAGVAFMALFPIVNPFPAIPIFAGLTQTATDSERKRMAYRTAVYVVLILLITQFTGRLILQLFDLSLGMLQIAGGLIVAHTAWQMATGTPRVSAHESRNGRISLLDMFTHPGKTHKRPPAHSSGKSKAHIAVADETSTDADSKHSTATQGPPRKAVLDVSFTPMAMPLLAGPGAMGIVIGLEAQSRVWTHSLGTTVGIVAMSLLVGVCLLGSTALNKVITPGAAVAMQRIFGFIILGIAVALVSAGISSLFGVPLHGSSG